ncbi:MAG: hypothetical protein NVV60_14090 [Luteimonas sp.]|nr:hypothetical protein [Luteimonas sp.]
MPSLDTLHRRIRWIALAAILLSLATWAVDLAGLVYICPFCRAQRTVIGLLGLLMLLPNPGHWLVRYLSAVLAAFGLVVAVTQHFAGWRRMQAGEFAFGSPIFTDPFLLSGAAIFIITGLVLLVFSWKPASVAGNG